jgi:excisionase family DNA binding protein
MVAPGGYRTVKSVAETLGVSRSLVYNLVAAGVLPAVRVGVGRGTIRIPEPAFQQYLQARGRDDRAAYAEHFA